MTELRKNQNRAAEDSLPLNFFSAEKIACQPAFSCYQLHFDKLLTYFVDAFSWLFGSSSIFWRDQHKHMIYDCQTQVRSWDRRRGVCHTSVDELFANH